MFTNLKSFHTIKANSGKITSFLDRVSLSDAIVRGDLLTHGHEILSR